MRVGCRCVRVNFFRAVEVRARYSSEIGVMNNTFGLRAFCIPIGLLFDFWAWKDTGYMESTEGSVLVWDRLVVGF